MNLLCDPNYFYCETLKATIRKQMCRDRQAAMHKNGETCVYVSCGACPQGRIIANEKTEGKTMGTSRVRGTCSNCEREGLMVQRHNGLCGSCQLYVAKVKDEKERISELARAKEKFKGGKVHDTGRRKEKPVIKPSFTTTSTDKIKQFFESGRRSKPPADPAPSIPTSGYQVTGIFTITLPLTDADMDLFKKIEASAVRSRRTVEQQILWIVEQQIGMEVDHE